MRITALTLAALVAGAIAIGHARPAMAADPPPGVDLPPTTVVAEQRPDAPVAAVGEEGTKPRRAFLPALTHNLKDDVAHLPRWNSLLVVATGGSLALAVHSQDAAINPHFVGTANGVWRAGKIVGQMPVILGAGLTTYVVGRNIRSPRVQHLGMDEIEASLITGAIVLGMKQSIRRDRPLALDGTRQSGFSFPSGHAANAFAAATVLQQHLGYRAGAPMYLLASYVAMSRLHENKHYASDVIMGSAIGVMVGRTVTWHGRHVYATPMWLPGGGGVMATVRLHQ